MFSKILVAADGSESSLLASKYAASLATKLGCKVTLIHVVEPTPFPFTYGGITQEQRRQIEQQIKESGRAILRLNQKPLADSQVPAELELREGRPGDMICQFAEEGEFDLIIIGNRGSGMVSRVLLGSVSQEVVRAAPCPVLVVRV